VATRRGKPASATAKWRLGGASLRLRCIALLYTYNTVNTLEAIHPTVR